MFTKNTFKKNKTYNGVIFLHLLLMSFVVMGCSKTSDTPIPFDSEATASYQQINDIDKKENVTSSAPLVPIETTASPTEPIKPIFIKEDEVALLIDDKTIKVWMSEKDVDWDNLFGSVIKRDESIANEFPYEGAHFIEIEYSNTIINLYSDSGDLYKIIQIDTTDKRVQTKRGLKMGDSIERLFELYPELLKQSDKKTLQIVAENLVFSIQFYVENGVVHRIRLSSDLG